MATKTTWDAIKTAKNVVGGGKEDRKERLRHRTPQYSYRPCKIGIELRCMQSFTEIRMAFYELCNAGIHRCFLPR